MIIAKLYHVSDLQPRTPAVYLIEAIPTKAVLLGSDFPEFFTSETARLKFRQEFANESDVFMKDRDQKGIVWVGKKLPSSICELDFTVGEPLEQPSGSKLVRDCSYRYLNLR